MGARRTTSRWLRHPTQTGMKDGMRSARWARRRPTSAEPGRPCSRAVLLARDSVASWPTRSERLVVLGDDAERARKAVTGRNRDVLRRLAERAPSLAQHLNAAVVTGRAAATNRPTRSRGRPDRRLRLGAQLTRCPNDHRPWLIAWRTAAPMAAPMSEVPSRPRRPGDASDPSSRTASWNGGGARPSSSLDPRCGRPVLPGGL